MNKNVFVVVRSISFGNSVGGMEKAASEHINEMVKLGYNVVLVAPENKIVGNIPDGVSLIGVTWPKWDRYKILMTMGIAYYIWCEKVGKKLNRTAKQGDIVHFHGASAGVLNFLNPNLRNEIFTIVNPHGMEEFGTGSFLRIINRAFTKWLIKKSILADIVIATDESIIDLVKKNLNIDDDKIALIPNSIDVFKLRKYAENGSVKSLNKNENKLVLVSIGRIEFNKGYDLLASALGDYSNEYLDDSIKWIHFGRGKKKAEVTDIAKSKNVDLTIVENATDAEVQSSLANCDIFVQPSRYEGSSLTTLEAMAHGCLIVATPVGGIPDKIKNLQTGFLCKQADISSIKSSLREAITYGNKEVIRKNAYEMAENVYDISASSRKYHELYSSGTK